MLHNGTVTGLRRTLSVWLLAVAAAHGQRFAILGDRTGEAQAGVWEQVWREVAREKPELVVTVGDTIQGQEEANAPRQWAEVERILGPYSKIPLYLTPGNHDVWSDASAALFVKHTGRPLHYSFDAGRAHFTVLDNSRADQLSDGEMEFLAADLKAHADRPVKFIVMHRPSWIMNVALRNPEFALHKLARIYGVKYVIAGHVHQMMRFTLEGVEYLSMPSAGGHVRASEKYEEGWFFAYTIVTIEGDEARFTIHELKAPHGQGRTTTLADWGMLGLAKERSAGGR